jgi:hypothetical protein
MHQKFSQSPDRSGSRANLEVMISAYPYDVETDGGVISTSFKAQRNASMPARPKQLSGPLPNANVGCLPRKPRTNFAWRGALVRGASGHNPGKAIHLEIAPTFLQQA